MHLYLRHEADRLNSSFNNTAIKGLSICHNRKRWSLIVVGKQPKFLEHPVLLPLSPHSHAKDDKWSLTVTLSAYPHVVWGRTDYIEAYEIDPMLYEWTDFSCIQCINVWKAEIYRIQLQWSVGYVTIYEQKLPFCLLCLLERPLLYQLRVLV